MYIFLLGAKIWAFIGFWGKNEGKREGEKGKGKREGKNGKREGGKWKQAELEMLE